MRKGFCFKLLAGAAVCLLTAVGLAGTALADVIWEPDDSFYYSHSDDCEYEGRMYIVNSEKGYADVLENPNSSSVSDRIENGAELYISFTYSSGSKKMGIAEYIDEDGGIKSDYSGRGKSGWINMDEMTVKYDNISFMDEHSEEITEFSGNLGDYIKEDSNVYFYPYPNSGNPYESFSSKDLTVESEYTDKNGLKWGYVAYHYGLKNTWVCLSDPENGEIPADEHASLDIYPAKTPEEPSGGVSPVVLVVIIVGGVVIVTLVLLMVFWKKKRR